MSAPANNQAAAVISSIASGQGKTTHHVTNTHNAGDEAKARDMTLASLNKDQTGRLKKTSNVSNAADDAKARDMTLATLNKDQHQRLHKTSTGLADLEKKNQDAVKAGVASEKSAAAHH